MTTEGKNAIVFKDQAGEYYLLPQETLEQSRVAEEHKARIEQLVAEQEDVQGHMWHALLTPLAVIATGAVLVVQEATKTGTLKGLKPR